MNKTAFLYSVNDLIGKEISLYLLERGLKVAIPFPNEDQVEAFLAEIPTKWQAHCLPILQTKISKLAIEQRFEKVASELGSVDLYIHTACWQDEWKQLEGERGSFAQQMESRLHDLFLYSQSAGKVMAKKKQGQIIVPLLSDALYYSDLPSSPIYNQGATAYVKSFAKELSPFRINVNAVEFGYYQESKDVPITRARRKEFDIYTLKAPIPQLPDMVRGLGMLLDYGEGMSGQTIQWGYGTPSTT